LYLKLEPAEEVTVAETHLVIGVTIGGLLLEVAAPWPKP
jgi:hypothetical protein